MTQDQINRFVTIKNSLDGKVTVAEAAAVLGISERQVIRLRNGVKEEGAAFMKHKNSGNAPKHALTDETKKRILELYEKDDYKGSNFQHFKELIERIEGVKASYSSIHRTLRDAGHVSPKKRRKKKAHPRRKRKAREGLLVQIDATPFDWFGDGVPRALHGAIDDATGKLLCLHMEKNECLQGYFSLMRHVVEQNGVPNTAYADRHTIFLSPKADKLTLEEQLEGKQANDTQFGRAMKELGIKLAAARSAQAKGRIERAWDTLQSRLPIEFRIRKISTIGEANEFLKEYVLAFNERFAVKPEDSEPVYSPLKPGLELDLILCVKTKRTMDNGGVFSFHGRAWKVERPSPAKSTIDVIVSPSRGILAVYKGSAYTVVNFEKQRKTKEKKAATPPAPPAAGHPWRTGAFDASFNTHVFSDMEIVSMLNELFLETTA